MKKNVLIFILFFTLFVGATILQITKSKEIDKEKILKFSLPNDVSTLHFSSSSRGYLLNSTYVITLLFEGLMRKDENGVPQESLAHKVDISRYKDKYTFYIRDANWSDGEPITAQDFEYSWKKAIDPKSKTITPSPYYYYPIKNAKRCLLGECSLDEVGITVIDDKTLCVELEYPAPYFLELVGHPFLFPAPMHIAKNDSNWANKTSLICNGPFILTKRKHDVEIVLSKNPLYWDKNNVYLDGIHVSIIPNNLTALNMFEKNQLDWIGAPFTQFSYDISSNLFNEKREDIFIYWLAINIEKYPFNNKKLRKALAYAIDRESIVKNIFDQSASPSMSALPSSMRLKNEGYFQDNNRLEAKNLFHEALAELGLSLEEFPEIELIYVADLEIAKRAIQVIQDQWRKVLGIRKVSLKSYDYNVFGNNTTKGDYTIGFMNWVSLISDPIFILNSFSRKSDLMNKTNWENEQFKELLDKSNFALGEIERRQLLIEAEEILMDEMPIIPICSLEKRFAKNPKLKGFIVHDVQSIDFKSAYFEDDK